MQLSQLEILGSYLSPRIIGIAIPVVMVAEIGPGPRLYPSNERNLI